MTIERNLSLEVLGPTKSKRTRPLTIGATTAAMIRQHFDDWAERAGPEVVGDWIFAPDYRPAIYARASLLSHQFVRFRDHVGVPGAALHRVRHAVSPLRPSRTARSSRLRPGSVTETRQRRCVTTPTRRRSTMSTSPTNSTGA